MMGMNNIFRHQIDNQGNKSDGENLNHKLEIK